MAENWESDEAENWEADEAIVEAEDSAEDIGERARPRPQRIGRFRPGRGVQGIVLPGQDGRARTVPFPTKLATATETNRGLASQEAGRRALEERLDRLEGRFRAQLKNDSSASGVVTLVIGGGLSAWGAINAARQPTGFKMGSWAKEESTRMAALTSVTQIATSGAKLAINGRYHRSGFGIAADIFAAAHLAAFAFGSLYAPEVLQEVADTTAAGAIGTFQNGTRVFDKNVQKVFVVVETNLGRYFMAA